MEILINKFYRGRGTNNRIVQVVYKQKVFPSDEYTMGIKQITFKDCSNNEIYKLTEDEFKLYFDENKPINQITARILYGNRVRGTR